jgi:hypothetical protein
MYSVRREELTSGKARDELGRGPAVADHLVSRCMRERGRREKGERRKRGHALVKFPPVTLIGLTRLNHTTDGHVPK